MSTKTGLWSSGFAVYQELRRRGELTVRVYARLGLDKWEHLAALGVRRGFGDDWVKIRSRSRRRNSGS